MCGKNLGYNLAILFAVLDIICGVIIYTIPGAANKLLEYLTHSTWQFTIRSFDPVNFIIGIILWAVIGFVIGTAFSKLCEYNADNKR